MKIFLVIAVLGSHQQVLTVSRRNPKKSGWRTAATTEVKDESLLPESEEGDGVPVGLFLLHRWEKQSAE